jgi:integrase
MWPGPDGHPITGGHLARGLTREAATVGVRVTLHDLRHTGASDVAAGGGSLVALRDILGHASVGTTSRYLWAARAELRLAIEGRRYKLAS